MRSRIEGNRLKSRNTVAFFLNRRFYRLVFKGSLVLNFYVDSRDRICPLEIHQKQRNQHDMMYLLLMVSLRLVDVVFSFDSHSYSVLMYYVIEICSNKRICVAVEAVV